MNQLLDSRLQVLAFDYVSFGIFTIVNNLWTWVAVITAAVSFWRIRAAGVATSSCSVQSHEQGPSKSVIYRSIPEVEEKPTVSVSAPASVCNDGVTKNGKSKLTVYYDDDIFAGESNVNDETTETEWSNGEGYCMGRSCGGDWWESWESVLRLRKGETEGWYRYQDLTAINGNVVRLWDASCRKGRYSSSCSVW